MREIVLVCEGPSDVEMLRDLADRVLCEVHPWLLDHDDLGPFRHYRGLDPQSDFTAWKDIGRRYREAGLHPGGFTDRPLQHEYHRAARKALRLAAVANTPPDGMIWFVDTDLRGDDDLARRNGLHAARREAPARMAFTIAIGVAHTKNEAWVVAGFIPADESEAAALQRWRVDLGFSPDAHPERIPRKRVKEVASDLCSDDADRRRGCWRGPTLETLRARGGECGLRAFLIEVREHLAPLLGALR